MDARKIADKFVYEADNFSRKGMGYEKQLILTDLFRTTLTKALESIFHRTKERAVKNMGGVIDDWDDIDDQKKVDARRYLAKAISSITFEEVSK